MKYCGVLSIGAFRAVLQGAIVGPHHDAIARCNGTQQGVLELPLVEMRHNTHSPQEILHYPPLGVTVTAMLHSQMTNSLIVAQLEAVCAAQDGIGTCSIKLADTFQGRLPIILPLFQFDPIAHGPHNTRPG